MDAMDKAIKKEFIKYTKKHYPDEADKIIRKVIYKRYVPYAKLIRTHTCALGSESCDYWYVGDRSDTAKRYSSLTR